MFVPLDTPMPYSTVTICWGEVKLPSSQVRITVAFEATAGTKVASQLSAILILSAAPFVPK